MKYKILIDDESIHKEIESKYYAVKNTFSALELLLFDDMKQEMLSIDIGMTTITAYYIASLFFSNRNVRGCWDVSKYNELKHSENILGIVDNNKNTISTHLVGQLLYVDHI